MRLVLIVTLVGCGRIGIDDRPQDAGAQPDVLPVCRGIGFVTAASPVTGLGPRAIAVGDLDRDGNLDLAVTDGDANTLSMLRGNGDGTFQPRSVQPTGMHPWSVAIADLGTGVLNVVVGNYDSDTVSVFAVAGGALQPSHDFGTGANPQGVAIGDVDGDHRVDLVTADHNVGMVSVLPGNGDGTFQPSTDHAAGALTYSVAIADLNGDGRADLATANSSGDVGVLIGTGGGTFLTASEMPSPPTAQPWAIAAGDINGDGTVDLAVANNWASPTSQTIGVFLGNGDGTFQPEVDVPSQPNPWAVALADLDGDGVLDLVVANGMDDSMSLMLGRGDGTFAPKQDFATGGMALSVAVGDVNNDGRPDVVLPDQDAASVTVLLATCAP